MDDHKKNLNIINKEYPLDDDNYSKYIDKFYNYNSSIAYAISTLTKNLNIEDILYVECGNCLYLDSFIGLKQPVLGISSNELSDKYALAYNLQKYYQHLDITNKMEVNDTFGMVLIINGSISNTLYKSKNAINNISKLTNRYILIIEDKKNFEEKEVLSSFVESFISHGFKLNCLCDTIFSDKKMSETYTFFLERPY